MIVPDAGSIIRNNASKSYPMTWDSTPSIEQIKAHTDDLPAPVRPQIPIFSFPF